MLGVVMKRKNTYIRYTGREKKIEPTPGSVALVKHSEEGKTIYNKMPT